MHLQCLIFFPGLTLECQLLIIKSLEWFNYIQCINQVCNSALSAIFSKVDGRISFVIETEMMENNKDRYQQIYQEALKAYPQDKKSIVQRKACSLWNIAKEKEKQDKSSTSFKDTLANLQKECLQSKSKITGFWASLKTRPKKPPKTEPPPMFVASKSNETADATEVVDDSMTPGSGKESGNKRDHKKETQNKLQTKLGEINETLASY